jgi:hypothetical protein
VSQTKFTPITSRLLARKGDAVPSMVAGKPSLISRLAERKASAASKVTANDSAQSGPPAKPHKMTVMLSAGEYEKLGIAAVKKGVTRHQLVRTALDLHLEQLRQEYSSCSCMGGSCDGGCGAL